MQLRQESQATWATTNTSVTVSSTALPRSLIMLDITTASLAPQHGYVLLTLLVSVFTCVHPSPHLITTVSHEAECGFRVAMLQGTHVYAVACRQSP